MKKLLLIVVILLTACVASPITSLRQWERSNIAAAKSGDVRWADYYKSMYGFVEKMPDDSDKAELMRVVNIAIKMAEDYHQGVMTTSEFEAGQRNFDYYLTKLQSDAQMARSAAWGAVFQAGANA